MQYISTITTNIYKHKSPITPLSKHPRQLPQKPLINLIKPPHLRTININQPHRLTIHHNRHHNLTPTLRITRNMPREREHVVHAHGFAFRGGGPAHAPAEVDELAGGFALEGAEEEDSLVGVCGGGGEFVVADVEAGPVYVGGEDGVGVPEEGGDVCGVAFSVSGLNALLSERVRT